MSALGLERPYGRALNWITLHRFDDPETRNAWAEQRPRTPHPEALRALLGAKLLERLTPYGRRERLYEPLSVCVRRAVRAGQRTPSLWRPVESGHDMMRITILGEPAKD